MKQTILSPLLIMGMYILGTSFFLIKQVDWVSWTFFICCFIVASIHLKWYNDNYDRLLIEDFKKDGKVSQ